MRAAHFTKDGQDVRVFGARLVGRLPQEHVLLRIDARGGLGGDCASDFAAFLQAAKDAHERIDHLGVELRPPTALEFDQAVGEAQSPPVDTLGRHGVVAVGDTQETGHLGDGLAGQAIRIPFAIVPFVVVADGGDEVWPRGAARRSRH